MNADVKKLWQYPFCFQMALMFFYFFRIFTENQGRLDLPNVREIFHLESPTLISVEVKTTFNFCTAHKSKPKSDETFQKMWRCIDDGLIGYEVRTKVI